MPAPSVTVKFRFVQHPAESAFTYPSSTAKAVPAPIVSQPRASVPPPVLFSVDANVSVGGENTNVTPFDAPSVPPTMCQPRFAASTVMSAIAVIETAWAGSTVPVFGLMRTASALYAGKGPPNARPFVTYMSITALLWTVVTHSRPPKSPFIPEK